MIVIKFWLFFSDQTMEPVVAKEQAESIQLSSEISLNFDDQKSEKTSCCQPFQSLKRKHLCILITILLAVVASIAIGTAIGFSAQNQGNIGSQLLLCFTL